LPLDAATTARTAVGRAAEGASARSICTTLRWRLIVACVGGGLRGGGVARGLLRASKPRVHVLQMPTFAIGVPNAQGLAISHRKLEIFS